MRKLLRWANGVGTYGIDGSMLTMSALGRAATVAALVSGCSAAQVTQPLPAGPDTYTVSARTSRGGPASARDAAISAANQHCARLSKQLLVMSSSANTVPNENNPGTERKRERRRCVRPLPASHPLRLPSTASSRSRGEPQGVGFGNSLFFAEAVRF